MHSIYENITMKSELNHVSSIASAKLIEATSNMSDLMSFVAGIKCAIALEGFDSLNMSSLDDLKKSASAAGYDIEIVA
ncbi:hypothetical protein [Vibrio ostreicida]|uniref:hypothetical protein n=1 Tax=Vibrio ostreicida TaxID=526588 RepID=UPI00097141B1|nr:hypothetical protein [Vibrio ostreicida]